MNPTNLLLPSVIVVLSFAAGYLDGCEEADKINDRIARGDKRELTHWWEWTVRVVFLAMGLFFLYLINDWFGFTQWTLVGYAGMSYGVFVPTHRYFVNTRRTTPKRPWWWMGLAIEHRTSKDSAYDHMWHWITWKLSGGIITEVGGDVVTVYSIDIPARYAYAFELLVALASLVLVTAQLWI